MLTSGMRIENQPIEDYRTFLKDKYRPPSKGGNTRAWHQHIITIGGERYSFLGLGSKKWVFARDTVTFDWSWDDTNAFRNIDAASIETCDAAGEIVVRGERGAKPWRTADTRLPARRSEWKD